MATSLTKNRIRRNYLYRKLSWFLFEVDILCGWDKRSDILSGRLITFPTVVLPSTAVQQL